MSKEEAFANRAGIGLETLHIWLDEGWIAPPVIDKERVFRDVDVARALLIQDLRELMGVNDEGIHVVLDLVDQLHMLRHEFDELIEKLRV